MRKITKRSLAGLTLITALGGLGAPVFAEVADDPQPMLISAVLDAQPELISVELEAQPELISAELDAQPELISAGLGAANWVGHWAEQDLEELRRLDLVSNRFVDDERIAPDRAIQVADAAEILLQMGQFAIAADRSVVDQAVEQGLIEAADFAEGAVSRELFARWTARAMRLRMLAEYAMIYMQTSFADDDQIDPGYRNAVAILQERGVIAGNLESRFAPKEDLTYAQAFRMLYNVRVKLAAESE